MDQETKTTLSWIIQERMNAKAKLNIFSYMVKTSNKNFDREINVLLDYISQLDKLEQEIRSKLD